MQTLKEIKDQIFKPEDSNNSLQELYKTLVRTFDKLGYTSTFSIDNMGLFTEKDDGINYEVKIIKNLIDETLGIPKVFRDSLVKFVLTTETDYHSGSFLWNTLEIKIYPPQSILKNMVDLDIYRNYEDIKWLMDGSEEAYKSLEEIKKLFPWTIN
jgi:hypothetical protein